MIKNARILEIDADPKAYLTNPHPRGSREFVMSSSALRVFSQCPARWVKGYTPPDSDAKDYGSLLDTLVLQPHLFKKRYAIKPATYKDEKTGETKPWNGNSNVCKRWLQEHADFEVVHNDDVNMAQVAVKALESDEVIKAFLEASDRAVWLTGEWHDEKTGVVVPLKALLDLVPRLDTEFCKCAGDLKTTRNAAVIPWTRWAYSAGYYIQASFYVDLLTQAQPERDLTDFCFILSENYAPFQSAKRLLSADFIELGRNTYRKLLANYSACLKAGRWPGYDDHDETTQGWSIVSPLPWMEGEGMFEPKFELEDEAPTEENADIVP